MVVNLGPEDMVPLARSKLPENYVLNAFKHCPNLRKLKLDTCVLKRLSYAELDLQKKVSLDKLDIHRCVVYPGALEQLSMLLKEVKKIRLCNIMYRTHNSYSLSLNPVHDDLDPEVVMPHTRIGVILFHEVYIEFKFCIRVFAMSEGKYHYFRYDGKLTPSTESVYLFEDNEFCINICCQNVPKFEFVF